jgi:hypothetical protein
LASIGLLDSAFRSTLVGEINRWKIHAFQHFTNLNEMSKTVAKVKAAPDRQKNCNDDQGVRCDRDGRKEWPRRENKSVESAPEHDSKYA